MESGQGRLDLLEQALLHLRQELEAQTALADTERSQLEHRLTDLLNDHHQLDAQMQVLQAQLREANQQLEQRNQMLRQRELELQQLQLSAAEQQRELHQLRHRLLLSPATVRAQPTPSPSRRIRLPRYWRQLVSLLLAVLLGGVASIVALSLLRISIGGNDAPTPEPTTAAPASL